ncbi:MAG: hypothetical protein EOO43_18275, partial [Flavobacterium sp.]
MEKEKKKSNEENIEKDLHLPLYPILKRLGPLSKKLLENFELFQGPVIVEDQNLVLIKLIYSEVLTEKDLSKLLEDHKQYKKDISEGKEIDKLQYNNT